MMAPLRRVGSNTAASSGSSFAALMPRTVTFCGRTSRPQLGLKKEKGKKIR